MASVGLDKSVFTEIFFLQRVEFQNYGVNLILRKELFDMIFFKRDIWAKA
jgi:hypothetical protein